MPQLDINTWVPQLFWLAVCFIVLYALVSRVIIPRTGGVIELRKSTIDGDLAEAQRLKLESEADLKAYETSLAEARTRAAAHSLAARNQAAADQAGALSKLNAELAAQASESEKSISSAKSKALASLNELAAEISSDIVGSLTGAKVSKSAALSAVEKAVK